MKYDSLLGVIVILECQQLSTGDLAIAATTCHARVSDMAMRAGC